MSETPTQAYAGGLAVAPTSFGEYLKLPTEQKMRLVRGQAGCPDCARLRAVNAELAADYDSDFAAMREDRNMFRAQTADLLSILKAVRPWLAKAVDAGVFSECVRPSGGAIIQSRIEAAIKEAEAAQ